MATRTNSVARSDYNQGWCCFAGGRLPPVCASRAFIDGYNRSRDSALQFARSMNMQRDMCIEHGVPTTIKKEKVVHGYHMSYDIRPNDRAERKLKKLEALEKQMEGMLHHIGA